MPATPAHIAAILPGLQTRFTAWGVVPAALVAGSMAPDFHYVLWPPLMHGRTHSLAGALTFVAAEAVLATILWRTVLGRAIVDLLPDEVRRRAPMPRSGISERELWWLYPSAAAGALSHVLWDALTHEEAVVQAGPFALHSWLWWFSTVAGLAVLGWWSFRQLRRAPARPLPRDVLRPQEREIAIAAAIAGPPVLGAGLAGMPALADLSVWASRASFNSARVLLILTGSYLVWWWALARLRSLRAVGSSTPQEHGWR